MPRSEALALLVAGALAFAAPPAAAETLCSAGGTSVSVGFERARASACTIGPDGVRVVIRPETTPINDSAWYAFRLSSDDPVWVTIVYEGGTHRYTPDFAGADGVWRGFAAVDVAPDRRSARILPPGGVHTIAAAPLETADAVLAPWRARAKAGLVIERAIGQSRDGRRLFAYRAGPSKAQGLVVLLARQHPPETSGAIAFDAFAARLFEADATAAAFRARFAIIAAPLTNPDGFAAGHWRTNAGLVDLNRDFGAFTQPETRVLRRAVLREARRARPIALLDFHATRREVIYAQPLDAPSHPPGFVDGVLADWTAALGAEAAPISRAHDPDSGNAKTWGRLALGVAGLTYEAADEADPEATARKARLAADLFMQRALSLPGEQP